MTYELVQSILTLAIESTAIIGLSGIVCHWLLSNSASHKASHKIESLESPASDVEQKANLESKAEIDTEAVDMVSPTPSVKPAKATLPKKPDKKSKPTKKPMSIGAAAIDYSALTSQQLREECALQGVNWRNGGNNGKPMKKAEMIAALK